MPIDRRAALLCVALCGAAQAKDGPDLRVAFEGSDPQVMFDAARDGCGPIDMPDVDPRAFRDAQEQIVMFALHYVNHALRGPDLEHLKIDCKPALDSSGDADPSHYDDRRFITALWTKDGRDVTALVHHEYHAELHDRCSVTESIGCWHNTILSFSSHDGAKSFAKDEPLVVASAPFAQDVEQGRHRGFFNPSNIVSDGRYDYMFASTTGWAGQPSGACLFRTPDPARSGAWRAFDGSAFAVRYHDPYRPTRAASPASCAPIAPFNLPVGTVVRHRASGRWVAVWMATRDDREIPVSGFYYASSADLMRWTPPRLLRAGATIHQTGCGGTVIAYPSLIDEAAQGRTFDNVGDGAWLYYTSIKMEGCSTGARLLLRERVRFTSSEPRGAQP